ncbi:hypothetical protein [Deinococcus ruber]|uniref:hypothetical protein n=1 Tax=Deinococcus ruber TaxID=1848197 RepID=UPI00166B6F09|nr:hypothetical protein [Deinococcus ruber]
MSGLLLIASSGTLASGATPSALVTQRQAAYRTVMKQFDALARPCGPRQPDAREVSVYFPVNSATQLYVINEGRTVYTTVSGGQANAIWCAYVLGSSPKTLHSPVDNTFVHMLQRASSPAVATQWGRLPSEHRPLDGYIAFAQAASVQYVAPSGQQRCSQKIKAELGLSAPIIVKALQCPNH